MTRSSAPGFLLLLLAAALAGSGCAPASGPEGQPLPDPTGVAEALEERTRLESPLRIGFRWTLREPDLRASGEGVARVEPPYRARLDLFDDRLEPVSIAALVDHDLRVPQAYRDGPVPAPGLLWSALGVFRPDPGMSLVRGVTLDGDEGGVMLEYRDDAGTALRFVLPDGERVREAELLRNGRVVQEVELSGAGDGLFAREVRYRHLEDTRELRIVLESIEHVEPFSEDIWDPRG